MDFLRVSEKILRTKPPLLLLQSHMQSLLSLCNTTDLFSGIFQSAILMLVTKPISGRCSFFILPENTRKTGFLQLYITLLTHHRSSHQKCSTKKAALKNFAVVKGKHLCWSLFLIKLQAFRPVILLKRDFNTSVFL